MMLLNKRHIIISLVFLDSPGRLLAVSWLANHFADALGDRLR